MGNGVDKLEKSPFVGVEEIENLQRICLRKMAMSNDPGVDCIDATRLTFLIKLLSAQTDSLHCLVQKGYITVSYAREIVNDSSLLPEERALLLKLRIAVALIIGDWEVGRTQEEISETTGVVTYSENEKLLQEYHEYLYGYDVPASQDLIHVVFGCGDGSILEEPTGTDNFRRFGVADTMYFDLGATMMGLLREEYRMDEAMKEFVRIVSRSLMRMIYYLRFFPDVKNARAAVIRSLRHKPNLIVNILKDLDGYMPGICSAGTVPMDGEFVDEGEHRLSDGCRFLFKEAVRDSDAFLKRYFLDFISERSSVSWQAEKYHEDVHSALLKKIGRYLKILADKGESLSSDDITFFNKKMDCAAKGAEGVERILNAIRQGVVDIARHISLSPRKILLMKFSEIFNRFLGIPFIHFGTDLRAFSHSLKIKKGEDEEVKKDDEGVLLDHLYDVSRLLLPRGFFRSDSMEISYTRESVYRDLMDLSMMLADEFGPDEFKITFVEYKGRPTEFFIERKGVRFDGETSFPTDIIGDRLILQGGRLCELDEFTSRWPKLAITSQIIARLSRKLTECLGGDEKRARIYFRGVRKPLDSWLEDNFFCDLGKKRLAEIAYNIDVNNNFCDALFDRVIKDVEIVKKRIEEASAGKPPYEEAEFMRALRGAVFSSAFLQKV